MAMKTQKLQYVVTGVGSGPSLDSPGLSWTPAAPPADLHPLLFEAASNEL